MALIHARMSYRRVWPATHVVQKRRARGERFNFGALIKARAQVHFKRPPQEQLQHSSHCQSRPRTTLERHATNPTPQEHRPRF